MSHRSRRQFSPSTSSLGHQRNFLELWVVEEHFRVPRDSSKIAVHGGSLTWLQFVADALLSLMSQAPKEHLLKFLTLFLYE